MSAPVLVPVKEGWFALGNGWAVVGATKTEARARYREAQRRHAVIRQRPDPFPPSL